MIRVRPGIELRSVSLINIWRILVAQITTFHAVPEKYGSLKSV